MLEPHTLYSKFGLCYCFVVPLYTGVLRPRRLHSKIGQIFIITTFKTIIPVPLFAPEFTLYPKLNPPNESDVSVVCVATLRYGLCALRYQLFGARARKFECTGRLAIQNDFLVCFLRSKALKCPGLVLPFRRKGL